MPPEMLDVEVSLVNTNNRRLLQACLATLPAACDGLLWHATVVDNASGDGSAEMVASEFPWAGLARNESRLGFSANHNKVVREVLTGGLARYVLILNEDTELDGGSVRELVSFCDENPGIGAAGPVIRGTDGRKQASFFSFPTLRNQLWAALCREPKYQTSRGTGWLNASCVLVRAEALREVGPLDERFFIFFEDTDLGLRLAVAGWSSAICERATILHHGHETVSQPALGSAMERQMLRSRYVYFRKHRGFLPAALVGALPQLAMVLRSAKAMSIGALRRDATERRKAVLLLGLAAYFPWRVLPHERGPEGQRPRLEARG